MVAMLQQEIILLANILWSHALLHMYWCVKQHCTHTSSAHIKGETNPVTGNQKNMFEAVCLESTEFLAVISAPL